MLKKRDRILPVIVACLIVVSVLSVFFYTRPKIIKRTMPGVIIDKETRKMVKDTSVSINLKHYRGDSEYSYDGKVEFKNLAYTKDNRVNIALFDGKDLSSDQQKTLDAIGGFSYPYSHKVGNTYEVDMLGMEVTVTDSDLSKFVVTSFDEGDGKRNNKIMVFPAETEEEALNIINQFKSKNKFWK